MLKRGLDDTFPHEVRERITLLTVARTTANACWRFAPPFLATVASGLGVSFATAGVAIAVSELSGLMTPITGLFAERFHRRTAMSVGLLGVGLGAGLAAASVNVVMFTVALIVLAQSKVAFDLGVAAWFADRVPYERRGRVIGLNETSWALGLLLGVTTMGLVTALVSWRAGYAAGALAVVSLATLVRARVADDPDGAHHARRAAGAAPLNRAVWALAVTQLFLLSASQALFVTFGTFLRDSFGFADSQLALVVFGLGFCELGASLSAARWADRLGKERAAQIGAGVMIPAALLIAAERGHVWLALPAVIVAIACFEFAVVCVVPLGTEVVPSAPARGMSIMFAAGTIGRALTSIPATRTYERWGMQWPATMSAALAACAVVGLGVVARFRRP